MIEDRIWEVGHNVDDLSAIDDIYYRMPGTTTKWRKADDIRADVYQLATQVEQGNYPKD